MKKNEMASFHNVNIVRHNKELQEARKVIEKQVATKIDDQDTYRDLLKKSRTFLEAEIMKRLEQHGVLIDQQEIKATKIAWKEVIERETRKLNIEIAPGRIEEDINQAFKTMLESIDRQLEFKARKAWQEFKYQ